MEGCAPARTRFEAEVTAARVDMAYCIAEGRSMILAHSEWT